MSKLFESSEVNRYCIICYTTRQLYLGERLVTSLGQVNGQQIKQTLCLTCITYSFDFTKCRKGIKQRRYEKKIAQSQIKYNLQALQGRQYYILFDRASGVFVNMKLPSPVLIAASLRMQFMSEFIREAFRICNVMKIVIYSVS